MISSDDYNPFVRVGNRWVIPGEKFSMPVISGGIDDGGSSDDKDDNDDGNDSGATGAGGTFTQDDVKRIATREKREGKTAGRKELMKELGVETEEDLKSALEAHRTASEKDKTEAQREKDAAAKERAEAAAEKAAARQERFEARCERALLKADCPAEMVEKVQRLLDIKAADEPDKDDIAEAVEALKKEMPQLFTTASGSGGNSNSDPGKPPAKGGGQKTASEQAKDLLAQRHPQTVKT